MNRSFSKIRHIQECNVLLEQSFTSNKINPLLSTPSTSDYFKPQTEDSIRKFQNWVLNVKKNKTILGKYGADGDWGSNTQNAWVKYKNEYLNSGKKTTPKSNLGFPYNKLSNNPSSQFIAYIIKTSKGVLNDKEAYAEAAFNAIKSASQYEKVKKFLGQDPYKYIASFMDVGKKYHVKRVYEHYLELFPNKKQPTNKTKPENIIDFQNWVLNVKKDKTILGKYGADGDYGPSTKKAWDKYGAEYLKNNKNTDNKPKMTGFVIPFAFPEYEPKVDGKGFWAQFLGRVSHFLNRGEKEGTYGKLGHAGVATVTMGGNVQLFEFGRYKSISKGVSVNKNLGRIAKISDGKITNLDEVINKIHRNTEGDGPTEKIEYAVLPAPNIESGIRHAKSVSEKDYSALDFSITNEQANCATFTLEVVKASGINIGDFCFPTPVSMIYKMKTLENPMLALASFNRKYYY